MDIKQIDDIKNDVALFRYGLIAPVVTGTYSEKCPAEYYRNITNKTYNVNGSDVKYAPSTIKDWYNKYRKNGFEALIPKTRSDFRSSRKLSKEACDMIVSYKEKFPHITGTLIYHKLSDDGYINPNEICLGTVLKYIRDNKSLFSGSENIDRRAFVMEFSNDCWQADTSNGPYLTINGIKTLTYLIAIIDDASRLIVGAKFFFNDNAVNFQEVLKSANKKYGIPKKLFVDNGSTYKNEQLSLICASLGMILIHARPFSGASKGKIERFFHTMKATWMRGLDWNDIKSIDELNEKLDVFINEYNNSVHSSLVDENPDFTTPNSRWFKDSDLIRKKDSSEIDISFLHTAYPTIRSDAIAYIKSHQFEVDMKYIKQKITVKYNPKDFSEAYIYEDGKLKETIKQVNKTDNSKIKRKSTLY